MYLEKIVVMLLKYNLHIHTIPYFYFDIRFNFGGNNSLNLESLVIKFPSLIFLLISLLSFMLLLLLFLLLLVIVVVETLMSEFCEQLLLLILLHLFLELQSMSPNM